MSHIYIGLTLCLIGVLLAYFILPKFLLVALFIAILAGLQFKDEFIIFRYLATHVASIYLWFCEVYNNLVNMYHQSNNVNFPVRKRIDDNGTVLNKVDRLNHRLKTPVSHNLNSTYVLETQPLVSGSWNVNPNVPHKLTLYNSRSQSPLKDLSKLNINPTRLREDSINMVKLSPSPLNSGSAVKYDKENPKQNTNSSLFSSSDPHIDSSPLLDARLFANVNSPGFCSRLAERLGETMTHQPQYETVGAFPVVNLKSQSPKVKVKAPVRVRLAPPSNDLLYSNIGAQSPRLMGGEESMKSVLQVLKEISRKRIHSNVDEDSEDNSKRLRIGETQYEGDGGQHTSLLQQTIQGKRAREDSSPNEDDIKKRHKPLQNNEIMSSLSSSISIKPPHLQSQKRKALDDPITLTPVLGKLLKVQPEIITPITTPSPSNTAPAQEFIVKDTPSAEPVLTSRVPTPVKIAEEAKVEVVSKKPHVEDDDDGVVSRLLGRMSGQVDQATLQPIPVKKDIFASTNDLSLSPPKENRLAAMIAVLGGPCEELGISSLKSDSGKSVEPIIKGKALFTTPETPETPKSTKKVTFSESLTATKIFDKDASSSINPSSTVSVPSVVSHATPLSTVTFGITSSPVSTEQNPSVETLPSNVIKPNDNLSFGLPQFSSGSNDPTKKIDTIINTTAVSKDSALSQQSSNFSLPTLVSSPSHTPVTSADSMKSGGFKFVPSVPIQNNDCLKNQLPASVSVEGKPINFGAPPQASHVSSEYTLSMPNSTSKPIEVKATVSQEGLNKSGLTKPLFNMFANKNPIENDTKKIEENKQMTNGFESTNQASFTFNASSSLSTSIKPNLPAFSTTPNNTLTNNSPFTFGSTATPTTSQIPSLTTSSNFQFTAAPQTAAPSITSTTPPTSQLNIFSNAASSPFGATVSTSSQNQTMFGNSMSQSKMNNPLIPSSSQNSTFGNSMFGNNSQMGENKAASTSQNNLFGGMSSNTTSMAPSMVGTTPAESTVSKGFGFVANSSFVVGTSSTTQANSTFGNSLTNTQPSTMFGSVSSSTAQKTMFSAPTTTPGQPPAFSLGISQNSKSLFSNSSTIPSINSSSTPAFGNQITTSTTAFGNLITPTPNAFGSQTTTSGTFGIQSTITSVFGSQNPGTNMFGSQNTLTTNAFGSQVSSSTNAFASQSTPTSNAFGNQVSSTTNAFGNQSTPTTNAFSSQNTSSTNAFGSQGSSTNAFGNQGLSSTNAFGSQNSLSNSAFGSQGTSDAGAFGKQSTTTTATFNQSQNNTISSFGNQTKPVTFDNQTNNINNSQTNFNTSGTFSLGQNTANPSESKPSPFGSSPFMFGSSSTNKEAGKPIGAAAPFSFGTTGQASPSPATTAFGATSQQPPAFGASSQQPPAFGTSSQQPPAFGTSGQQPPAFGTSGQQPPAFGSTASQPTPAPAGPVFAFGQTPTAPGSTFQFNAAGPQAVQGGGMFSIGSGSMAPRSKTGPLRRRHKPT